MTKVYNFDPAVNELGVYAEDFCIATTENSIFIPGKDPDMPVVSVLGVQPEILYNEGGRYLTIAGKGMSFLKHAGFRGLELVKEEDETVRYAVATDACSVSEDGNSGGLLSGRIYGNGTLSGTYEVGQRGGKPPGRGAGGYYRRRHEGSDDR